MINKRPICILVGLIATVGCGNQSGGYGALKRQIHIDTVPSGREVYVIPNTIWLAHGGDANSIKLSDYGAGFSPLTVYLDPKETVIVGRDAHGQPHSLSFVPEEDGSKVLVLEPPNDQIR